MSQPSFHLAYFRHHTDLFRLNAMATALAYALIPRGLASFVGYQKFETISDSGRPGKSVLASRYELLTLRRPEIPPGLEDLAERQLLQVLLSRALAASHVVPPLSATTATPAWSKMALPREVLGNLRRVGGL